MDRLCASVGTKVCEEEILPQVLAMSAHKARERRAVAAELCGVVACYVSPRGCDAMMATMLRVIPLPQSQLTRMH